MATSKLRQCSMKVLETEYDKCCSTLEEYLKLPLDSISDDSDQLKLHAQAVKSNLESFKTSSRRLSERLISSGSVSESQKIRNVRTELQKDAKEVIDSINVLLMSSADSQISDIASQTSTIRNFLKDSQNIEIQTSPSDSCDYVSASSSLMATESVVPHTTIAVCQADTFQHPSVKNILSGVETSCQSPLYANTQKCVTFGPVDSQQSFLSLSANEFKPRYSTTMIYTSPVVNAMPSSTLVDTRGIPNSVQSLSMSISSPFPQSMPTYSISSDRLFVPSPGTPPRTLVNPNSLSHSAAHPFIPASLLPTSHLSYPPSSLTYYSQTPDSYATPSYLLPPSVPTLNSVPSSSSYSQITSNPLVSNFNHPPLSIQHEHGTEALSTFLMTQDVVKRTIEPFDGSPLHFWSWLNKIKDYIRLLKLTPLQVLQLLESHCKGEPRAMISQRLASTGVVAHPDVEDVFQTLERRYGSTQKIASQLVEKLHKFPVIKSPNIGDQLETLHDLCKVIEYNQTKCPQLMMMNLPNGLQHIRTKLPEFVQREWAKFGQRYEDANRMHPPFREFVNFIKAQARLQSNKNYEVVSSKSEANFKTVKVMQTSTSVKGEEKSAIPQNPFKFCQYHKLGSHSLVKCNSFKKLPHKDKKQLIFSSGLCFVCLGNHIASNCTSNYSCPKCKDKHNLLLHQNLNQVTAEGPSNPAEPDTSNNTQICDEQITEPSVMCTSICKSSTAGQSCSKTVLVEISMKNNPKKLLAYCIIDEQSSDTLVDETVIEYFGIDSCPSQPYRMKFAHKDFVVKENGKVIRGLQARGVLSKEIVDIPLALTCSGITDTSREVATPSMVKVHEHTRRFAKFFPEFDPKVRVLILVGRNCERGMATRCHSAIAPYVHWSPLGYSLVGRVCRDKISSSSDPVVMRTSISKHEPVTVKYDFTRPMNATSDVFAKLPDDDDSGMSIEDKEFLQKMESDVCINSQGNIQLPLPTKNLSPPDNGAAVYFRTKCTLNKLKQNKGKLQSCLASMKKNLEAGYVEQVSFNQKNSSNPTMYLPIFSVHHPRKNKTRLVYDASARYGGISLNDILLSGPDLNNYLRAVLLRFREKPIGFAADIESMFSAFKVPPSQRDLLRFYWFGENDPGKDLVAFRSTSHLFGCSSSPAVANFALKYCASLHEDDPLLRPSIDYIRNSFYVDDGVSSADTTDQAIEILSGAADILARYNIRLHKIASNSQEVLGYFPDSEVSNPQSANNNRIPAVNHVLGVSWDPIEDSFCVDNEVELKPFTYRGILSFNNSFYDPIGYTSPLMLTGKVIQRELISSKDVSNNKKGIVDWDTELPESYHSKWSQWTSSLGKIRDLKIPRQFYPLGFNPVYQELHVFCDASDVAIGIVAYMRSVNESNVTVAFVTASSKVSPRSATTIPRMELCAAPEAAKCVRSLVRDLSSKPVRVYLYSDSRIVLGYLNNTSKRFSKYVERRISFILDHTKKENWHYVCTDENSADIASRPCHSVGSLLNSIWLTGPEFLYSLDFTPIPIDQYSEELPEQSKIVSVLRVESKISESPLRTMFQRVSSWRKLVNIAKLLVKASRMTDIYRQRCGISLAPRSLEVTYLEATVFLIKCAQSEEYSSSLVLLRAGKQLPDTSQISELSPYLHNDLIVVGGRLKNANIAFHIKHPLLVPKSHPISSVLSRYLHEQAKHQGGHISHAYAIQAGFHFEGGRQIMRKIVKECLVCRKLRQNFSEQVMADLPIDRVAASNPFENVGIDVFGPFFVHDGNNTRRTKATKKIWAVIYVCLPSRAIHLEPLQGLDTASFRNALSRFVAVRGPVKIIRSDQGTNFVSSKRQLEAIDAVQISNDLETKNIKWIMNPPHSSHHGGAWERKIGSVRRILEASFALVSNRGLSRDEFHTFLAEASSVVNNTPLWVSSADPNDPNPLTPAMLITLREGSEECKEDFTPKDMMSYGTRRYRRVQYLADQFWHRWRTEYLQTLTRRCKWKKERACLGPGDIVLLRDRRQPRNHWPMGRVESVKRGDDNLVRSAYVSIPKSGTSFERKVFSRPVTELVLLLSSGDGSHHPVS